MEICSFTWMATLPAYTAITPVAHHLQPNICLAFTLPVALTLLLFVFVIITRTSKTKIQLKPIRQPHRY